jgi:hypothetical protein
MIRVLQSFAGRHSERQIASPEVQRFALRGLRRAARIDGGLGRGGTSWAAVEDETGEACWEKLAASPEIRDRLHRVELEGAKDVSDLHKQDPERFGERLREALRMAAAWEDLAESESRERAQEAWEECRGLAESADILSEFSRDLEACRVVGERTNGELLFLALVSRLLDKIVSVAVKGPSSGGKSYLVNLVMSFFLASAFCRFTAMSEKTLLYTEEPLSHRHIVLSEAAGLSGDFQDYVIRTLLSEGSLEYEFVEKTSEGLRPRRITKEGPTGFITTTTRDKLHAENETRYLSITVADTREQTRRIFRALADESTEEPDRGRWHALQAWLEGAEHRVVIPYAGALAERMGDVAVRLRRDFSVVLLASSRRTPSCTRPPARGTQKGASSPPSRTTPGCGAWSRG